MRPGRYAWFTVRDTGVGIDERAQARLFEPFFTTKVPAGVTVGLGLSTVYGIVKQLDGYIQVDSAPGSGTTFTVYLPEHAVSPARAAESSSAAASPSQAAASHGGTVLIAEDELSVREPVRRVLERFGYRVIEAADGGAALDLAESLAAEHGESIDLLLTDVVMPGMSGRELARRLRQSQPAVRVLFMSGYSSEAVATHGMLAPDAAFLQKPFSVTELVERVRETLSGASS
jgi:CheY-like chemotaxis protein